MARDSNFDSSISSLLVLSISHHSPFSDRLSMRRSTKGRMRLFIVVAALGLLGCPKAGVDKAETATAAPSPPAWMSLKDGKVHRGLDEAPIGLYAAGDDEGGRFTPSGDVEGAGPIGESGTKGWLDLATGKFVPDTGPQPPPPFIDGTMTPSGFSPSSRKIHY
jgi:hypothetical protein